MTADVRPLEATTIEGNTLTEVELHIGKLCACLALVLCIASCTEESTEPGGVAGSGGTGGDAGTAGDDGTGGGGAGGAAGIGGQGGKAGGGSGGLGGGGGSGGSATCTPRAVPALARKPIEKPAGSAKWSLPVYITQAPGAPELYVVEQTGRIWVVRDDAGLSVPFLDLEGFVSLGFEEGLLGLAFHPDYNEPGAPDNGRFFVYYTQSGDPALRDVVAEYRRSESDPFIADSTEVQRLIDIGDKHSNHNGGMLAFGPEGYLYVGIGDEGLGFDPSRNGQNLDTLFATILRLDVSASSQAFAAPGNPFSATSDPPGDPRIWHYGLRNPWRFSFDRATGDMFIGDVGQNAWEEINFASAGTWANFGWSAYEASDPVNDVEIPTPITFPIRQISHASDPILERGNSVTGGYVYRGSAIEGLQGFYLYADFGNGNVAAFERVAGEVCNDQPIEELSQRQVSSFGEDNAGELYIMHLEVGEVYRIIAAP